jgi:hypothetical protein
MKIANFLGVFLACSAFDVYQVLQPGAPTRIVHEYR